MAYVGIVGYGVAIDMFRFDRIEKNGRPDKHSHEKDAP